MTERADTILLQGIRLEGCHGATVEMHGPSSISHWVETGFVVSGVDASGMRSILFCSVMAPVAD